jgi:acetyl-CoA carboxylase biotin carboxyl carrier protein
MDIRKVKKLIELLEESGIAELEIKEGEESVKISRYGSGATAAKRYQAILSNHPWWGPFTSRPLLAHPLLPMLDNVYLKGTRFALLKL